MRTFNSFNELIAATQSNTSFNHVFNKKPELREGYKWDSKSQSYEPTGSYNIEDEDDGTYTIRFDPDDEFFKESYLYDEDGFETREEAEERIKEIEKYMKSL